MSDAWVTTPAQRWYRSLYWRIGLGLVAFLALMLGAQAALFVWMVDQTAGSIPARSPRRLAVIVASDVAAALDADPSIDLAQYVRDQYAHVFQPFAVIMRDGRVTSNRLEIPEELRAAIAFEAGRQDLPSREDRRRRVGDGPPDRRGRGPGRPDGRRGPPPGSSSLADRAWESAPIFVAGELAGRVAVLSGPPFSRIVRELGPTMAVVAIGVLGVGALLVALFVFGPARRRLKAVESATTRLGGGDLSARAPTDGGDEVAAVARAFNRMADELAERAEALEASDRARRQLLADVSHELMTPLTAMRGYVETLGMPDVPLDDATRARYLQIIDDETHRLERIVGDLLDLAKLEGGGVILARERVSIASLFERVRARHERESVQRRIRIEAEVGAGAEVVTGDPSRLEQALQNLAANALRHTPDGGVISLTSSRVDNGISLHVRDSGPGIPDEHLPLIFDRFYKADASRRAAGGSGLGLSIVKAIVERHGGSIAARNENGAVFDIRLHG
jgi:two-component system sensor histidine kinase BaeS